MTLEFNGSSKQIFQIPQSLPNHFYLISCAIEDSRSHILPIASIDDKIDQVLVLFENQLRICAILDHLIFVPDGCGENRLTKFLHDSSGDAVIWDSDPHRLFVAVKDLGDLRTRFENKCKRS